MSLEFLGAKVMGGFWSSKNYGLAFSLVRSFNRVIVGLVQKVRFKLGFGLMAGLGRSFLQSF